MRIPSPVARKKPLPAPAARAVPAKAPPKRPAKPSVGAVRQRAVQPQDNRPDRKMAILLAAEKLFAQLGYHSVTIRQIAQEAGVPLALVGYYYGQKHELFEAIFAHWNDTIEARLSALREAENSPDVSQRLHLIIQAFVGPVLRMRASPEGEYYALLVARELFYATDVADRVMRAYFDPLANAFIEALQRALPHTNRGQVAWCYQFSLGALMHHLSDGRVQRLSQKQSIPGDPAAQGMLVNFIVGGIRAALPPPVSFNKPRR